MAAWSMMRWSSSGQSCISPSIGRSLESITAWQPCFAVAAASLRSWAGPSPAADQVCDASAECNGLGLRTLSPGCGRLRPGEGDMAILASVLVAAILGVPTEGVPLPPPRPPATTVTSEDNAPATPAVAFQSDHGPPTDCDKRLALIAGGT